MKKYLLLFALIGFWAPHSMANEYWLYLDSQCATAPVLNTNFPLSLQDCQTYASQHGLENAVVRRAIVFDPVFGNKDCQCKEDGSGVSFIEACTHDGNAEFPEIHCP